MLNDSKHPNDFVTQIYAENTEKKNIENTIQDKNKNVYVYKII